MGRAGLGLLAAHLQIPARAVATVGGTRRGPDAGVLRARVRAGTFSPTTIRRRRAFAPGSVLGLDRLAANEAKAARRLKRGGGTTVAPLDFVSAEGEVRRDRDRRRHRSRRVVPAGVRARALRPRGRGGRARVPGRRARGPLRALCGVRSRRSRRRRSPLVQGARRRPRMDSQRRDQPARGGPPCVPRSRARGCCATPARATRNSSPRRERFSATAESTPARRGAEAPPPQLQHNVAAGL